MDRKKKKNLCYYFFPLYLKSLQCPRGYSGWKSQTQNKKIQKRILQFNKFYEDLHKQGRSSCWVHSTTATNFYTPPCPRHHAEHWELIHSSQQSYNVDAVITPSSKDEETEAQRNLKSCLRSSSEDVAKTGYSSESLAPGLSSEPVCYCYDPWLSRGLEGAAEYRSCPYLITLSWALMFSCDIFMRRSGNWMSAKKVRSLGSQPMSKRCSRAVWMQDRAGSKDLKKPWRWKLPKLPVTHEDDRNRASQRPGMSVSGKRREPQTAGLGSLRYLFKFLRLHTSPLQRTS